MDQSPWTPEAQDPWPHHTGKSHASQESLKHRGSHSTADSAKHSSPHSSSDSLKHKGSHSSQDSLKKKAAHTTKHASPHHSTSVDEKDNGWVHVEDTETKHLLEPGRQNIGGAGASLGVPSDSAVSSDNSNLLSVSDNKMLKSESVISLSSRLSLSNSPVKQLDRPTMINISTIPLPSNLATELVGEVRRHTKLSYDKSCLAVEVVLTHIANKMPQTAGLMEKILCTFQEVRVLGLSVDWT